MPIVSVDGVHFRTKEFKHERYSKNTKYYSHKFKTAALNYEIAIDLYKPRVVHTNGPFPAARHDLAIFCMDLMGKVKEGQLVIGDKGYIGQDVDDMMMTPNSHDPEEVRKFKGRARARHESFNKVLKRFHILDNRFMHSEEQHKMCFDAVLVICQYQMEMGAPIFDV